MTKYLLPSFLESRLTPQAYSKWLARIAQAHARRDRKRWNREVTIADYKQAIHDAVVRSKGFDAYTGESLHWELIGAYDNSQSKAGGSSYKRKFDLLPTVDHVDPEGRSRDFEICGWRTNDCKHDLTIRELREFCRLIVAAK